MGLIYKEKTMTELATIDEKWKLSPEALEICEVYLLTNSIDETYMKLGIPRELVVEYLGKKEVKRFLDTIYLQQGYLNRNTLVSQFEDVIRKKLVEMEESEIGSSKDIADLYMMMHKIRMDELKAMTDYEKATGGPKVAIQQNNYGENYGGLLEKLLNNGS